MSACVCSWEPEITLSVFFNRSVSLKKKIKMRSLVAPGACGFDSAKCPEFQDSSLSLPPLSYDYSCILLNLAFLLVCMAFYLCARNPKRRSSRLHSKRMTNRAHSLSRPSHTHTQKLTLKSDFPPYPTFHSTFTSAEDDRPVWSRFRGGFLSKA